MSRAMNERIASAYPYPIAAAYRSIFAGDDDEERMRRVKDATTEIYYFLLAVGLADVGRWPAAHRPSVVGLAARRAAAAPMLGTIARFLVEAYLEEPERVPPGAFLSAADLDKRALWRLNEHRIKIEKRREEARASLAEGFLAETIDDLERLLLGLDVLARARLLVPLGAPDADGACDVLTATGAEPTLVAGRAHLFTGGAAATGPLLHASPACWLPLEPFLVHEQGLLAKVVFPGKHDPPRWFDLFRQKRVEAPRLTEAFGAALDALCPDFRYQGDEYLTGAAYKAERYTLTLEVSDEWGDTRNTHELEVRQIRLEDAGKPVRFKLDYHDLRFPVPDAIFGPEIHERDHRGGRERPVPLTDDMKEIWNDAFRSFSVGFASPLAFDEVRQLSVAMFEPGLFRLGTEPEHTDHRDDYYEFSFHLPVEEATLTILFPRGVRLEEGSARLGWFEDPDAAVAGHKAVQVGKDRDRGGRTRLTARLTRPVLDRRLLLRFRYAEVPEVDFDHPREWWWTSHLLYQRLARRQDQRRRTTTDAAQLLVEEARRQRASALTLRPAVADDLPALAQVFRYANPHASAADILVWTRESFALPEAERCLVAAVAEDGRVVGGAVARLKPEGAVIDDIAIEPPFRGSGVAKQLWEHVVTWARGTGRPALRIEVHALCADAVPWYFRRGARLVQAVRDKFGPTHDAIILELPLGAPAPSPK